MATHSSILASSKDREAWQSTVHGVAKSWTQVSVHSTCSGMGATRKGRMILSLEPQSLDKRVHLSGLCPHSGPKF